MFLLILMLWNIYPKMKTNSISTACGNKHHSRSYELRFYEKKKHRKFGKKKDYRKNPSSWSFKCTQLKSKIVCLWLTIKVFFSSQKFSMFMWFFSGNRQEDFQPNKITVVCINSNKTTTTKKKEKSKHSF